MGKVRGWKWRGEFLWKVGGWGAWGGWEGWGEQRPRLGKRFILGWPHLLGTSSIPLQGNRPLCENTLGKDCFFFVILYRSVSPPMTRVARYITGFHLCIYRLLYRIAGAQGRHTLYCAFRWISW